jgi:hypothetical protein
MGISLSYWLHRISRGWVVLAAALFFLVFIARVAPEQAARAEEYAGDAGSPDLSIFYTPDELYRMAEIYGERGREAYVQARFTFDLVFPVAYTLFLATALSWLSRQAFPESSRWRLANLLPVLGMLFDYGENLSASLVMARYPDRTPLVDWLAPFFTLFKWAFLGASFALLLVAAVCAVRRWAGRRGS